MMALAFRDTNAYLRRGVSFACGAAVEAEVDGVGEDADAWEAGEHPALRGTGATIVLA